MPVVIVEINETEEAAKERHFAEHPEDRDASNSLIVQLVDPTENVMNGDQHISLIPIEARFLTEYLIDFDTKAAAIRAGYDKKTAKIKGHVLLQIPTIKAAITRATEARDGPKGEGSGAEVGEDIDPTKLE